MIVVAVHTIYELKKILGRSEVALDLSEESTVRGLLEEMVKRWGEDLACRLLEPDHQKVLTHIRIMVNGRDIGFLSGLETVLQNGDEVLILPPAGGG